ncbi:MAG TPA: Smr/MutS family protein [Chitinophagaceae bacterium]|nr:Smr/MutS family protein [Chitinophagaceae bacterium]
MKYQVGDIVLILHSNEEGVVVDIMNDKMMMVDVKGVTFPVYMDQVDFPYFKRFTEKKKEPPQKEKKYIDDVRKEKGREKREADGVWLTFLPVMDTDEFGDDVVEELKLHLHNRTETAYHFIYKLHFFGKPDFELKNTVHPFEDFYLHDIPFSDLNDSPSFEFEFTLVTPDKAKAEHTEVAVKLKPKQLFARIEEIKKKNQATFSHLLFEAYPDKIIEDRIETGRLAAKGYKVYEASKGRQHLEPARTVVDLHIEKITDDWKHLSNFEILSLQLKTFEKYYHLAIVHHQPSLIVIHGVGEGRLRDEIHDILRLKSEVKSFVNQYDPRFGYGATEIFFQN